VLRRPFESALAPSVAVMHKTVPMHGQSIVKGLFQCVEHEAGVSGSGDAPTNDAAGIGVDHEGDVDEAGPGRDIGEVGDPERVRSRARNCRFT